MSQLVLLHDHELWGWWCNMAEMRSWLQCVGCVDIADRRHRLIVASSVMYSWIPNTARLHELVEAEVDDDFHLMPIVPCCCMIWIHAGNGIWFEYEWMTVGCCCCFRGSICMSLMYLPAKQLFNGMRFWQRVCWWAIYFGSRVEAMDGKATVMPPVCCILRMCVGIDHCNYILGLLSRPFLRNRYSRVRVSYDAMWVLLCTLHSAMDYRLFFSGLFRSILMWSIVRETATKWFDAVAGYATFEWWIVAMMILSFMIFNRRLLW